MKSRKETIIGYKRAKEALENQYQVIAFTYYRGDRVAHLFDPGSKEICERIRSDSWEKLRKECHLDRQENFRSNRSMDYFWKLGPKPAEPDLVPMPGIEKLADLKEENTPSKLMLYTFGCNTYGGQLVTIKIPATDYAFAAKIARKMRDAAQELIDIDDGLWLNDEEDY